MNKYLTILIAFVAMLFAVDAAAYTPPPAPAKGWYVVDQTGRMTPDQIKKLNQKIDRISKATKNEFGILLLQDMGGENIEDVANATYKAWGIGKRGLDNGALIVVALKERKSRIETGKGSEGEIPDLRAADILKNNLNPHLKTGDFYGGFDATIDATSSFLESRRNQKADPPPAPVAATPVTTAAPTTTAHATPANSSCDVSGVGSSAGGVIFLVLALGAIGILFARSYLRRKREEEAAERKAVEDARRRREERAAKIERERRLEAARKLNVKTPVAPAPYVDRQVSIPPPPVKTPSVRPAVPRPTPRPVISTSHVKPHVSPTTVATTAAVVAGAGIAGVGAAMALAEAEERAKREAREAQRRREREEEEQRAEARRQRDREEEERRAEERRARAEREEEERRQRERDEEAARQSSYSSYSSYSSSDSSSSSDSGSSSYDSGSSGSDSGGGFGGGDSGGGGSSSDW